MIYGHPCRSPAQFVIVRLLPDQDEQVMEALSVFFPIFIGCGQCTADDCIIGFVFDELLKQPYCLIIMERPV